MGAVNKVEYILPSSRNGFADTGDIVTINKLSAPTIKKDIDNGFTKNVSRETQDVVTGYIEDPNFVYTESEDGEDQNIPNKNNISANSIISAAINLGSLMFSTTALVNMSILLATQNMFIDIFQSPVAQALSFGSIMAAFTFDPDLMNKLQKDSESDEYIDILSTDTEEMTEQIDVLTEELEEEGGEDDTPIDEPVPEGDGSEDDATTSEAEDLNAETHETLDLSHTASEALINSTALGVIAATNAAQLGASSAMSQVMSARALADSSLAASIANILASNPWTAAAAAKFYLLSATDAVASGQFTVAGGLFAGAAATMLAKSGVEFTLGNKEKSLNTTLEEAEPVVEEHDEMVEHRSESDENGDVSDSGGTGGDTGGGTGGTGGSTGGGTGGGTGGSTGGGSTST